MKDDKSYFFTDNTQLGLPVLFQCGLSRYLSYEWFVDTCFVFILSFGLVFGHKSFKRVLFTRFMLLSTFLALLIPSSCGLKSYLAL